MSDEEQEALKVLFGGGLLSEEQADAIAKAAINEHAQGRDYEQAMTDDDPQKPARLSDEELAEIEAAITPEAGPGPTKRYAEACMRYSRVLFAELRELREDARRDFASHVLIVESLKNELHELRALLPELIGAVEFDDNRLRYITVQVDREAYEQAKELCK